MYKHSVASTDEQLHLWAIKHNKYTFNLVQWLIINTNRKSIT